jgi:hypothetical protein
MTGFAILLGPTVAQAAAQGLANAARPDLNKVLDDYQQQEDRMTEWSPKFFGSIPIPLTSDYKVTATEGDLLDNLSRDRGLVGMSKFEDIKDQAFDVSADRYPKPATFPSQAGSTDRERVRWTQNDGHRDAFRHAYWNALLTKNFGEEWTRQFANAHEGVPGNQADREAMDLYNNEVGRKIALDNPGASDAELADLVQKAVSDGKMVVIDSAGKLQWSDQVAYGQHGKADDAPKVGGRAIPDGSASAH